MSEPLPGNGNNVEVCVEVDGFFRTEIPFSNKVHARIHIGVRYNLYSFSFGNGDNPGLHAQRATFFVEKIDNLCVFVARRIHSRNSHQFLKRRTKRLRVSLNISVCFLYHNPSFVTQLSVQIYLVRRLRCRE